MIRVFISVGGNRSVDTGLSGKANMCALIAITAQPYRNALM